MRGANPRVPEPGVADPARKRAKHHAGKAVGAADRFDKTGAGHDQDRGGIPDLRWPGGARQRNLGGTVGHQVRGKIGQLLRPGGPGKEQRESEYSTF